MGKSGLPRRTALWQHGKPQVFQSSTTASGPASPPLPTAVEDALLGSMARGFMMESGTWLGGDDGAGGWARRAGPGHRVPARCGVPAHFPAHVPES